MLQLRPNHQHHPSRIHQNVLVVTKMLEHVAGQTADVQVVVFATVVVHVVNTIDQQVNEYPIPIFK